MINYLQKLLCKIFNHRFTYLFCYQYENIWSNKILLGSAIRGFSSKNITIQKILSVEEYSKTIHPEIQNNFVISFSYMGWLKSEKINEII